MWTMMEKTALDIQELIEPIYKHWQILDPNFYKGNTSITINNSTTGSILFEQLQDFIDYARGHLRGGVMMPNMEYFNSLLNEVYLCQENVPNASLLQLVYLELDSFINKVE